MPRTCYANLSSGYDASARRALRRKACSLPSEPLMVSLRGRCFDEMTLITPAKCEMHTTGAPAWYVPGTASSRVPWYGRVAGVLWTRESGEGGREGRVGEMSRESVAGMEEADVGRNERREKRDESGETRR
eukprot:2709636-Pleurochrysis_carterae.AAC.1